jgi:hypothetical protein
VQRLEARAVALLAPPAELLRVSLRVERLQDVEIERANERPADDAVHPGVEEAREGAALRAVHQHRAVGVGVVEMAGDVPGVAHGLAAVNEDRDQMLAAERQFLFVTVPAQLDRGIEALVRQRHAHAPAIRAVPAPMLVDKVVKRDGQLLPVMRVPGLDPGIDPRIHRFATIVLMKPMDCAGPQARPRSTHYPEVHTL